MTLLPNVITILRVAGSFILLFFNVTDVVFWCLYCLCGFSDIIDGFLARKFKCATKTGGRHLLRGVLRLETIAIADFAAMALGMGRNNCHDKVRKSTISTRLEWPLLFPSHLRQQDYRILALHRGPNDLLVDHSHLNRSICRNVCSN